MVGGISLFEFLILLNENVIMEMNFVSFFSCEWSPISLGSYGQYCYIDLGDPIFGCKILQKMIIEVGFPLSRGITKVTVIEDEIIRPRQVN